MSERRCAVKRGAHAPARRSRGEPTLLGIGPAALLPASVRPDHVAEVPTVRVPVPAPSRRVDARSTEPEPGAVGRGAPAPDTRPSTRLDSAVSGRFFREGEAQEANGWEGSPLLIPRPTVSFDSFDRIPRRRWPIGAAVFLVAAVVAVAIGADGLGSGTARVMAAVRGGAHAIAAGRAVTPPSAAPVPAAATGPAAMAQTGPGTAGIPAGAPSRALPADPPRGPASPTQAGAGAPVSGAAREAAAPPSVAPARPPVSSRAVASRAAAPASEAVVGRRPPAAAPRLAASAGDAAEPLPPSTQPTPGDRGKVKRGFPPPRHGLVWSPSAHALVPAQPAFEGPPPVAGTERDVLPLDDVEHSSLQ